MLLVFLPVEERHAGGDRLEGRREGGRLWLDLKTGPTRAATKRERVKCGPCATPLIPSLHLLHHSPTAIPFRPTSPKQHSRHSDDSVDRLCRRPHDTLALFRAPTLFPSFFFVVSFERITLFFFSCASVCVPVAAAMNMLLFCFNFSFCGRSGAGPV